MTSDYKQIFSIKSHIESFIKDFKKVFENEELAEKAFTRGNCYHFAVILEALFNGDIMYNPVENHFAFMDNELENLWDITGLIGSRYELTIEKNWYLWKDYEKFDAEESKRIIEQCMYKIYVG